MRPPAQPDISHTHATNPKWTTLICALAILAISPLLLNRSRHDIRPWQKAGLGDPTYWQSAQALAVGGLSKARPAPVTSTHSMQNSESPPESQNGSNPFRPAPGAVQRDRNNENTYPGLSPVNKASAREAGLPVGIEVDLLRTRSDNNTPGGVQRLGEEAKPASSPSSSGASESRHIALCITGHLRSFYREGVHESILKNLVGPLNDSFSTVHVFFHVGEFDKPRKATTAAQHEPAATWAAIRKFQPVSVSFYNRPRPSVGRTSVCRRPLERASSVYPPSLVRANECFRSVIAHEIREGIKYDWVIKTRPDIAFRSPIPSLDTLRQDRVTLNDHLPGASTGSFPVLRKIFPDRANRIISKPIADHIAMVPRKLATKFFDALYAADLCMTPSPQWRSATNPEALLGLWLVKNDIQYETRPWFWILVRDAEGPVCFRVKYIGHGLNLTSGGESLVQQCETFRRELGYDMSPEAITSVTI